MIRIHVRALMVVLLFTLPLLPSLANDYENALKGVDEFHAVFDYTHGGAEEANIILRAIDEVDDGQEVTSMPGESQLVIVFHDAAVRLLTKEQGEHSDAEWAEVQKFQKSLKEMKEAGVAMEVCQFALDVYGIDSDAVIPEIDQVPNGFVSVIGYQEQGYALVRIP